MGVVYFLLDNPDSLKKWVCFHLFDAAVALFFPILFCFCFLSVCLVIYSRLNIQKTRWYGTFLFSSGQNDLLFRLAEPPQT